MKNEEGPCFATLRTCIIYFTSRITLEHMKKRVFIVSVCTVRTFIDRIEQTNKRMDLFNEFFGNKYVLCVCMYDALILC